MSAYVDGKSKSQILSDLVGTAEPGSVVHEQQKMGIVVRCTEDLEKALHQVNDSMNRNAASNESLSRKILVLNIVIAVSTFVYAAVTVLQFMQTPK